MSSTIYTDDAVILAERAFGTADKIVTLFTKGRGLVKAAAFGCRRPNSPLAGGMQPLVEITVTLSEGSKVDTVRQYSMQNRHAKITVASDLLRFAYAALFAEAAAVLLPEQSPDEKAYAVLTGALAAAETRNPQIVAVAAIVQLLTLSGWGIASAESGERRAELAKSGLANALNEDKPQAKSELRAVGEQSAEKLSHIAPLSRGDSTRSGQGGTSLYSLLEKLNSLDWQNPPTFSVRRRELDAAEKMIIRDVTDLTGSKLKSYNFLQQIK